MHYFIHIVVVDVEYFDLCAVQREFLKIKPPESVGGWKGHECRIYRYQGNIIIDFEVMFSAYNALKNIENSMHVSLFHDSKYSSSDCLGSTIFAPIKADIAGNITVSMSSITHSVLTSLRNITVQ